MKYITLAHEEISIPGMISSVKAIWENHVIFPSHSMNTLLVQKGLKVQNDNVAWRICIRLTSQLHDCTASHCTDPEQIIATEHTEQISYRFARAINCIALHNQE